jgi:tRNA(Ile)-lysidine synthase
MREVGSLEERFRRHLEALGLAAPGTRLLVAVSGGIDSVALLHLLRFHAAELGVEVRAAHFDHAMREGSDADARWVEGLCRAWGVPLVRERAGRPLRGEAAARQARYAFLRRAADGVDARWIATAHHADDQAETVLFRVLRGTGISGLAGISPSTASGIVRPLLPFWREEIRRYARRLGLRWREDPTNRSADPARNRIRLQLLPLVERTVAPGARRSLVRLAELAREEEGALRTLLEGAEGAAVRREGGGFVLARELLRGYDTAVASGIVRSVLRHFGVVLDRTGTRLALQFISDAPSGRELPLPGGLRLATEFDTVRVERAGDDAVPDEPLPIPDQPSGEGRARVGGRTLRAAWSTAPPGGARGEGVALPREALRFPLLLRGWRPGDRIRTAGGTKRLKKLFGERRIPRSLRGRTPVLVDADGTVLWVAGVEVASGLTPHPGQTVLYLSTSDA